MKWIKAPEKLKDLLEGVMQSVKCEKRPMFGYPAYFINKNMFIGLFQDKLFARLSDQQLADLRKKFPSIANLEPMPGRPMKNYYVLPKDLYSDSRTFKRVIQGSVEYTRSLAPKQPKKKETPKKSAGR
jgi:TfoX/Sxy family transcriptional regulator of competence genes